MPSVWISPPGRSRCSTLALWALRDDLAELYGDVLAVWRPWARDLRGYGLDCGHHVAEETLADALRRFLRSP